MRYLSSGMPVEVLDYSEGVWKKDKVVSVSKGGFYVKNGVNEVVGHGTDVFFTFDEEGISWRRAP